jgi:hypothetical protein
VHEKLVATNNYATTARTAGIGGDDKIERGYDGDDVIISILRIPGDKPEENCQRYF